MTNQPDSPSNTAPLATPEFSCDPDIAPQTETESTNGATESCCHGQSESASGARGSDPSDIQAPRAAAQIPNPTATNPPSPPAPNNQASEPQASAANSTPDPGSRTTDPGSSSAAAQTPSPGVSLPLSQQWLSTYFLHQHEKPKAFESLLNNHIHAYQPSSPSEELLVFRITQKAWLLRRVETWERVIADSRVAKIRAKNPNAAAPACIAMSLLEIKETDQTRFYERTARFRKEHEDTLDRLVGRLETLQSRREDRLLRAQLAKPSTIPTAGNTMPPPASILIRRIDEDSRFSRAEPSDNESPMSHRTRTEPATWQKGSPLAG